MEEMKTSGMVERASRAILKSRFFDCEPDAYGGDLEAFYRNLDPDHVIGAHFEARAAIQAMREPTEAMTDAADLADHEYTVRTFGRHSAIMQQSGYDHWVAMVDAALSEPQP